MSRTILIFGARGQVGGALAAAWAGGPYRLETPGRAEVDLADAAALASAVRAVAPDLVVNAAAFTDVDGAESSAAEAEAVNAAAPGAMAQACAEL